jgi:aspartate aminotransferase
LLCGAVPKIVPTNEKTGFRITPQELQAVLTPKTRLFILNSPSNPTGTVYGSDELAALSRVLEPHGCLVVSDDVYEKIIYDGRRFHNILTVTPQLRERTILVNSMSKTYAMTGWRIGYATGPAAAIAAAAKIQSQSTSNPTSIAQAAALEAVRGPQDEVKEMVHKFQMRRDVIVQSLNKINGVRCPNPHGAFYVFPNFGPLLGRKGKDKIMKSAVDLAEYFLEEAGVATVPGEDFGSGENIRLSYATSLEEIEKGCDRIEAAIKKLH